MLNESELLLYVESQLSENRFNHTIRVLETALKLSYNLDVNVEMLRIACIAHDMTKENKSWQMNDMIGFGITDEQILSQPHVWHGFSAAYLLEFEFGIREKSILNAVKFHTIGSPDLDLVGKILYVADYIEPGREQKRPFNIKNESELNILLLKIVREKISYFEQKGFDYHQNIKLLRNILENQLI